MLILIVVLAVLVALPLLAVLTRRTTTASDRFHPVARVEAHTPAGRIEIGPSPDDAVHVDERIRQPWFGLLDPSPTVRELDGTTLRLRPHRPSFPLLWARVDYRLRVPPGTSVAARSSAGEVRAGSVRGELELTSSAGKVVAVDVEGPGLRLTSSAGRIEGRGLRCPRVHARSSAGKVELAFETEPEEVDATSSAGTVVVRVPSRSGPYRVDAGTSAGRTELAIRTDPAATRSIRARSSAGNVGLHEAP